MGIRYEVETSPNDDVMLQNVLSHIAADGGKVIHVEWQPEQTVPEREIGWKTIPCRYLLIVEYESDA